MYLNEKKVNVIELFSKIKIGIYSFFDFFFTLGVVAAIFIEPDLRDGLWVYASFSLFFSFLLYNNLKKMSLMKAARMYNSIFELDFDGYLPLEDLALKTEKSIKTVSKEIKKLIGKHILQNASLEFGDKPQVVLMKKVKENEVVTESVECPYCGATAVKRKGFACKCEFCGNDIM